MEAVLRFAIDRIAGVGEQPAARVLQRMRQQQFGIGGIDGAARLCEQDGDGRERFGHARMVCVAGMASRRGPKPT